MCEPWLPRVSDAGVWDATGLPLLARIITLPLLPKPGFPDQTFRLAALLVGELMRKVAFLGALALVMALISLGPGPVRATVRAQHVNSVGGLDCNGFSLIQKPVRRGMLCTEIAANTMHGFEDTATTSATTSPPPSSSPASPVPAAARATRSSSRSSRPASRMAASPARWGPSRTRS